ncbi:MAG TPA: hypothetical protein VN930_07895 [Xanthobacteraceae bacterium]|nr:hypothetical protein [Xanthobacteraceae bacterium]
MTCEVAVMNRRGIALAADSAVTLGEGEKIYHSAEKLFPLSPPAAVGIMTHGSADFMGVPWEIIIKIYGQKLDGRRFETLEQYAHDFLRFVEGTESLFPQSAQRAEIRSFVKDVWQDLYLDPLKKKLVDRTKSAASNASGILEELIHEDHKLWNKHPIVEELGPAYGDHVVAAYGDILDELQQEMFGSLKLSRHVGPALRTTVRLMHTTVPSAGSGVVIAGMGESDLFPILLHYRVGSIAVGRLRYAKVRDIRVTRDDDAMIVPFAQRETIDMIIRGIFPELEEKFVEMIARRRPVQASKSSKRRSRARVEKAANDLHEKMEQEVQRRYAQPFMAAVAALPRHDLAAMAEALVNLTAFRARMSVTQKETVGGPIDIAVLSKGEGFVWVKRKDSVWGIGSQTAVEVL